MRSKKKIIDRASIEYATGYAKGYFDKTKKRISDAENDVDRAERLGKGLCIFCYYLVPDRIGGCAITSTECGICDNEITFGSTNVDKICPECSKENGLCKHCGADIELKQKRKPYPFMLKKSAQ